MEMKKATVAMPNTFQRLPRHQRSGLQVAGHPERIRVLVLGVDLSR